MTDKAIHLRELSALLERKDEQGLPFPFNARVFKKDGTVATFVGAVCTSSYHKGTRNLLTPSSGEVRTVRDLFFIEVNGKEVLL